MREQREQTQAYARAHTSKSAHEREGRESRESRESGESGEQAPSAYPSTAQPKACSTFSPTTGPGGARKAFKTPISYN